MSSDYLRTYAQSADANALADAAPLTALQKKLIEISLSNLSLTK